MCSKSFSRKDNLHKHRKTHGVMGPYVCESCGKSFVVKHYYLMHKASHGSPDSPEENLPYRCDICYKGFSVKQYLTTHKLRHRGKVAAGEAESQEPANSSPLSTVNTAAITPVYHVTTSNNTTYLTSVGAGSQLGDSYRRLPSS